MRLRAFAAHTARRFVACLLALLVPLQGAAAGVVQASGPLHRHLADERTLVLEDVRRVALDVAVVRGHRHDAAGHPHRDANSARGDAADRHEIAQRHHHLLDDGATGAVVRVADPWRAAADGDAEAMIRFANSGFVALLASAGPLIASPGDRRYAPPPAETVATTDPDPLERPPRSR